MPSPGDPRPHPGSPLTGTSKLPPERKVFFAGKMHTPRLFHTKGKRAVCLSELALASPGVGVTVVVLCVLLAGIGGKLERCNPSVF